MRTPNGLLADDQLRGLARRLDRAALVDDARHEPDAVGFGRVDEAAGEQQLERARRADEARQHPRDADVATRQADAHERDVEARRLRGDAHVARERQRETRRPTRRR